MSDAEHSSAQRLPSAYSGGKRRGQTRRAHTVGKVVLASLVTLAMITGLSVAFLYRHLNGNLNVQDLSDQMYDRPDKVEVEGPKEPMNVLVMGSDTREGEGNKIDGESSPGLSDTTILVHLSADRKVAYGVSIPRDTLVERPDCKTKDGDTIPGASQVMWNQAFALGGPACTMQQLEQMTGIRIDNYVVVDFAGFQDMVDAIDGVEVCIPEDIEDPAHDISIAAGTRELRGREALNYVRVRYTVGDGSDIGRIARQQAFIAAMASKVVSGGTLARVDRLVRFLNAATNSLTTDLKNIREIAQVGLQFKKIGLKKIQFITAPWEYSEAQPGRVELLPEAEALWEKIRNDAPLGKLRQGAINAGEVPGASSSPSASPSESASEDPSPNSSSPSGTASPSDGASPSEDAQTQQQAREQAGLCT